MFSGRQVSIIKIILDNNLGVHGSVIADTLSVSSRTIRNEINEINKLFGKALILSNNKTGYSLNEQYKSEIKLLLNDVDDRNDGLLRSYEILGKVLFDAELQLEDLSELMNYSSQTIRKDIQKLDQHLLSHYQISLIEVESEKIKIKASEEVIRETLFKILKDAITSNNTDYAKLLEVILDDGFKKELLDQVLDAIFTLCDECEIQISIENIKILQAAVVICIVRNEYNFTVENEKEIINPILLTLMSKVSNLNEKDLPLLQKLIHTFKIIKNDKSIEIHDFSRVVLDEFIDEVFDKYNLNLKESDDLYNNMLVHIEYMLRRIENGYELRNPIISDIKSKYPFAYEVSMLVVHIVYKYKNRYILDDEVSYLAIYIEHFLENINEKIRAVLVSSQRHSINQVLEKWIDTNFKNQIVIQKILDKTRMQHYNLSSFDLILTFNEQIYSTELETFAFNGLPEMRDVNRLNECIHTVKMNQRIKSAINNYIHVDLIKIFDDTTFENVIEELSNLLENKEIIDSSKEFSEDVIAREINYPTNLGDTLMMPHPLYTFANKTAVAIGVIKKGIEHNENVVRLVFLLAIEKVRNSEINFIFQFFKQISNNKNLLKSLYESETKEEMISNMFKFSSSKN
ncbi:BglG family transcription antiterminator [Anaerorhabdus sp.]|uniref:BglG family transcription antiterminator n=1 Tax=Anaerorhabdus sp. TaxID=1872524 RepID=UPI002B218467|nr:PTS sugar transporter subunit IIA [Anaerorhabdus sp.]MEA4875803.1 PTS sugar transporter subunit IIA [Anaerorhabdus sp.]